VRAVGFREDTFERRMGRERHRWLRGLGNAAIETGRGPMRLRVPADVHELLGLALAQHAQGRRVVFFCSCSSPWASGSCHRGLVRQELLRAASRWSLGTRASSCSVRLAGCGGRCASSPWWLSRTHRLSASP